MAEQLGKQDEEATIRRRLAFALWAQGDLRGACQELEKTVDLLEASRYTSQSESDQKVFLFRFLISSCYCITNILQTL